MTEMSPQQLAQRGLIVDTLRAAGWQTPTNENEMFDEGFWLAREAVMSHAGPAVTLWMFYRADQNAMYIQFEFADGSMFELKLRIDEKLPQVLQAITSFQDEVTNSNYRDHIRTLMTLNDEIYVSVDGDNFVKLTDVKRAPQSGDPG
jgi:hypothetical protein